MRIYDPCIITPRLLPGVQIGDAFVSVEYAGQRGRYGKNKFNYYIDLPGRSWGEQGSGLEVKGGLQEALEALLAFLSVADDESFTPRVIAWARKHSDEIAMLLSELEEEDRYCIDE